MEFTNDRDEARKFWDHVREQVARDECDFRGRQFPEDPSLRGFDGLTFAVEARFEGATFEGVAYFRHARFRRAAIFEDVAFQKEVSFRNVVFEGPAIFSRAKLERHSDFVEATFGSDALFVDARIANSAFYDSRFRDVVNFSRAQFGKVTFHRAVFEHYARFRGVRFERQADFPGATFMRTATFEECVFEGRADFSDARAAETVVFPLHSQLSGPRPFRNPEQGETAYRFAKRSAMNIGDFASASDYQFAERCAAGIGKRRSWRAPAHSHLSRSARAWRVFYGWVELILFHLPLGYGEKPARVMATCVLVIMAFAVCYWHTGGVTGQEADTLTLLDASYFSAVTFTTLGYGDYHPTGFSRLLASSEAFLGAFLMATFVVVLGRRYMR